jgi:hypothetical protein
VSKKRQPEKTIAPHRAGSQSSPNRTARCNADPPVG